MKYVQINHDAVAWAEQIIFGKHRELLEEGNESYVFWGRGIPSKSDVEVNFNRPYEPYIAAIQTRFGGRDGFYSKAATKRLLRRLDEIKPDIVHLHNLHGYFINVEMLFNWLARSDCKVIWTLHDCWAFTGHCAHFTYVKCAQWRRHCAYDKPCPQLDTYPKTFSKTSVAWNFEQKKRLFTMLSPERVQLITPSQWLADLVKESFLSKYEVVVKHNTVDLSAFKTTPSDFRQRYGLEEKFIILGVANTWTERKGFEDFLQLSGDLDDKFAIVMVGLTDSQIKQMPTNVVALGRTESKEQLAEIYTAADVFFNPTKEDNYPTVNLEAEACGTPVVTYDTGGCKETIGRTDSTAVDTYLNSINNILQREIIRRTNKA